MSQTIWLLLLARRALRGLRPDGAVYTGYYSEDGANWTVIGQHTNNLTSLRVGLIAAQAAQAETTADFDYFTVTTLP